MSKKKDKTIYLILLLALLIRIFGITHGFPGITHPDEPTIIRSALGVRFFPNPGHFDWPHLYIYVNYALFISFAKLRDILVTLNLKETISGVFPLFWNDDLIFYLLGRVLTAFTGALTIIPIYKTGKKLFNEKVAILSALCLALMPFHIHRSRYAMADVPMVFFISWAMYFCVGILENNKILNYILSGLFVGLAASTKYNGALIALLVPFAHFARIIRQKMLKESKKEKFVTFQGIFNLIVSGVSAFFAFFLGTPYAFLDYKTFSRTDGPKGAYWQFTNVGSVDFRERIYNFFIDSPLRIIDDVGYVPMIFLVISILFVLFNFLRKKYSKNDFAILPSIFIVLITIFYISGFQRNRSHHFMIMYPFLALVFGYIADYFIEIVSKKQFIGFLVTIIIFSPLLYFSYLNALETQQVNTQVSEDSGD